MSPANSSQKQGQDLYPIQQAAYDFTLALVAAIEAMPRARRFTLGDRLVNLAYDVVEQLTITRYSRQKRDKLRHINLLLERLRVLLRLTLGERTTNLYRVEDGFPCLGYRVSPRAILVRRNTLLHFRRRTHALQRRYRRGEVTLAEVRLSLMGTMGHLAQEDSLHLREGLLRDAVFSRASRISGNGAPTALE